MFLTENMGSGKIPVNLNFLPVQRGVQKDRSQTWSLMGISKLSRNLQAFWVSGYRLSGYLFGASECGISGLSCHTTTYTVGDQFDATMMIYTVQFQLSIVSELRACS